MRKSICFHAAKVKWTTVIKKRLYDTVRKYIPNPRDHMIGEEPVPDEEWEKRKAVISTGGLEDICRPGQDIPSYMTERDKKWKEKQLREVHFMDVKRTKDGVPFYPTTRDQYASMEHANSKVSEPKPADYEIDEETKLLRRQLQLEKESEYRKFVSELKRNELKLGDGAKQRLNHVSDPSYNPFKITPSYRPQDSRAVADWLKRQRESGFTTNGISLNTKEGQERFYNEEKMSTQFHSNVYLNRVDDFAGMQSLRIEAYSPDSVFINNKEVIGSVIVTANRYYHWNVSSFHDINEKSLALIKYLYPVVDVLFIGTGRNQYFLDEELQLEFLKRGTNVHTMTTPRACAHFGHQLMMSKRCALAIVNPIPTNSYGVECFGDFIENDMFSLSDSDLGIPPIRQTVEGMLKGSKAAEKYRHMQGTGFGPRYHQLPDGRLVRPGTHGTKLIPLLEPGETVEWEKLPSYYHWFPKETLEDYIENNQFRDFKDCKQLINRSASDETSQTDLHSSESKGDRDALPEKEIMPWDSASIPLSKFAWEKDEKEILVMDAKNGRVIGMQRDTFEKWKVMMKEREEGKPESDPVEFDQERFVTDKDGNILDLTRAEYRPIWEGRFHPRRRESTGRTVQPFMK
jgi:NADH dehydrogenase [ubiquinone] 1 alpha subcomplex assembly factor 3